MASDRNYFEKFREIHVLLQYFVEITDKKIQSQYTYNIDILNSFKLKNTEYNLLMIHFELND